MSKLSDRSRVRTSALLNGAYEIAYVSESKEEAEDKDTSVVLQLLGQWVNNLNELENEKGLSKAKTSLACTAVSAYGLIGKRSPAVALRGITRIFEKLQGENVATVEDIFAAGVASYVTLTRSGLVPIERIQEGILLLRQLHQAFAFFCKLSPEGRSNFQLVAQQRYQCFQAILA